MAEDIKNIKEQNETETVAQHPDYAAEIVELVQKKLTPHVLRDRVLCYHENDIAAALEQLSPPDRQRLFQLLDADTLSAVFSYTDDVGQYFGELSMRKKIDILSHSEADVAADYLRQLSRAERTMLIDLMDDDAKREIALIGSFDEDEIGSRMTTNFIVVESGLGIKQAMRSLVAQAAEHDNISTIYVVDPVDRTFCGAIDLKDLIIAREGTSIDDLVVTSYPYVYATEAIDDCIERLKEYSEDSIPVLDDNNKLLGVITSQDVVEVVDEELGDDYAKLAGLTAEEDIKEPLFRSMRKRLPWLIVLLGLGLIVSAVVGIFTDVVRRFALIICFQSLVLDMSGNTGTQSLAVTIRVLTGEALTAKQKLYLVFKEARVGFCNGLTLGLCSFVLVGLYIMLIKKEPAGTAFLVSACTGTALFVAMILASLAGTCIPMLFKRLKIHPAVASGPLITTLNDLVAVVTYYGLSGILLIGILGM